MLGRSHPLTHPHKTVYPLPMVIQPHGEWSSHLTNTLHLDSVLVVPSLNYILLLVSQITATLSCIVIFWPNFCVFKDIQTRETIGHGVKRE